jgi:hypothetical protein
MRRITLATGEFFLVLHSFHFPLAISQPVILMYATEEMVFPCPQPLIMKDSFMDSMQTVLMTAVPTHPTGAGAAIPTHPTGHQATLIAWTKEHQGLRPISTDTILRGVQDFKAGTTELMIHLQMDTTGTPQTQNCHPLPLLNGQSLLSTVAVPPPCHVTETQAKALILTALPHQDMKAAGQAEPHHVVLWLPLHLMITTAITIVPLNLKAAGHLKMAVVDTIAVLALVLIIQGAALATA